MGRNKTIAIDKSPRRKCWKQEWDKAGSIVKLTLDNLERVLADLSVESQMLVLDELMDHIEDSYDDLRHEARPKLTK